MTLQAREAIIETSIDDRRRRRHRLDLEVEARASEFPSSVVTVYDISDTGLLIETSASLAVGEMIEVNLPHAGFTVAEVVWASGQLVGCKFTRQLSRGAIGAARLGGRFETAGSNELLHGAVVFEAGADEQSAVTSSDKRSLGASLWIIIGLASLSWLALGALGFWIIS